MIVIDLPMPPPANNLFPTGRGGRRFRSPEYVAWQEAAGWEIQITKPGKITGLVSIDIAVSDKAGGDCANREKATVDLLVKHGVIQGDSKKYVRQVTTRWVGDIDGVRVTVKPWVDAYNARDDFNRSVDECYLAVKKRKAAGGKGWPK